MSGYNTTKVDLLPNGLARWDKQMLNVVQGNLYTGPRCTPAMAATAILLSSKGAVGRGMERIGSGEFATVYRQGNIAYKHFTDKGGLFEEVAGVGTMQANIGLHFGLKNVGQLVVPRVIGAPRMYRFSAPEIHGFIMPENLRNGSTPRPVLIMDYIPARHAKPGELPPTHQTEDMLDAAYESIGMDPSTVAYDIGERHAAGNMLIASKSRSATEIVMIDVMAASQQ